MKKRQNKTNTFFKRKFVQICRFFGFELIDQSNLTLAYNKKNLQDDLSQAGKKSIQVPIGETKITKKISSIKIIFRSCTSELIMDQNKQRIFEKDKKEYTFRGLNSLIKSIEICKKQFSYVKFELVVTDSNSHKDDIVIIKKILNQCSFKNSYVEVHLEKFRDKIVGDYSKAKFSNMANFYTSLLIAKESNDDLFFLVEDDYIFEEKCILEMLYAYEKLYTIFNKELILLPADYPYLYQNIEPAQILIGNQYHWRTVSESLVTFMIHKKIIEEFYLELIQMASKWEDPWETTLHQIYKKYICLSPIPSLSMHCANINSVYGISPNVNWDALWKKSKFEY